MLVSGWMATVVATVDIKKMGTRSFSIAEDFSKIMHSGGGTKVCSLNIAAFFDKKHELKFYFACTDAGKGRGLGAEAFSGVMKYSD